VEGEAEVAAGFLVVRASGAAAALAAMLGAQPPRAPEAMQLLMRCPVPRAAPARLDAAGCTLQVAHPGVVMPALVMLSVPTAKLSIGFAELRPLMFQPVPVDAALRSVLAGAVAAVLATGRVLDEHGLGHYLVGLAELVLRSALRAELNRVDALTARRREALEYIRAHLGDPGLDAERVAAALFVSRRRLYQLFDDGQGVSERIRGMRIDRAKALLTDPANGARGIADVAHDCGFVSPAHFSRAFRQLVGQSPREFRDAALAR
jgi:AraC-like DNA-binding protein